MRSAAVVLALVLAASTLGCGSSKPDVAAAKAFARFPLYWVGERFEKWELEAIDGLDYTADAITFIYGNCTPKGGEQPSCVPPVEIQVFPLCLHLQEVAAAPVWKTRRVRGAPVGTIDSAPVLFTSGAQVKVYRGEGTDPGVPLRVLEQLRSLNDVPPVVGATGPIPAPPAAVLDGTRPCTSA
jgi:hypothetical protein